jgi:protein-tyrosine-phosphatase
MIKSVLFLCNMNSVRSPMAAALLARRRGGAMRIDSAGVYQGGFDPFIEAVLAEEGVSLKGYEPKSMADIDIEAFDLIVALTPEAAEEARRLVPDRVEFWPVDNPSEARGGRDALMDAYRAVRDDLSARLRRRFPEPKEKP